MLPHGGDNGTADNDSITELVADINAQLNAVDARLRGLVRAGFDGLRLSLASVAAGANQSTSHNKNIVIDNKTGGTGS